MLPRLEVELGRWVPGEGMLRAIPLSGGWVNSSYLIERDGRQFSLRLAGADSAGLGADRQWECAVRRAAGEASLAPRVLRCDPETGLILAEWATGRVWSREDACSAAQMARLAALLRRVHSLDAPATPREMTPAAWCEFYARRLTAKPGRAWAARAQRQIARHAGMPVQRTLCHSDLHHLNVIDGEALQLLDWEYAHWGDPYWDLAAWIGNHDLESRHAGQWLREYLGRPPSAVEDERLQCLAWLFDYVCWLWCALAIERQHGGSAVGADLMGRREALAGRLGS